MKCHDEKMGMLFLKFYQKWAEDYPKEKNFGSVENLSSFG